MRKPLPLPLAAGSVAVVTIDIQLDYFGGYPYSNGSSAYRSAFPLFRAGRALRRTKALLSWARGRGVPVFHVRHESTRPGSYFFYPGLRGWNSTPGSRSR